MLLVVSKLLYAECFVRHPANFPMTQTTRHGRIQAYERGIHSYRFAEQATGAAFGELCQALVPWQ
jgi:hypothetical protein